MCQEREKWIRRIQNCGIGGGGMVSYNSKFLYARRGIFKRFQGFPNNLKTDIHCTPPKPYSKLWTRNIQNLITPMYKFKGLKKGYLSSVPTHIFLKPRVSIIRHMQLMKMYLFNYIIKSMTQDIGIS